MISGFHRSTLLNKQNRILLLGLVLGPLLFFVVNELNIIHGKQVYDLVLVVSICVMVVLSIASGLRFRKNLVPLLIILCFLVCLIILKVLLFKLNPAYFADFQLFSFLMEVKPLVYAFFVVLWLRNKEPPSLESWLYFTKFLSVLIILNFIFKIGLHGFPVRPKLADEANYDNLLVLLGVLSFYKLKGVVYNWELGLFFIATLVSQSKTGLACFFIISVIFSINSKNAHKILLLMLFSVFAYFVVMHRLSLSGVDELSDVDRFRMMLSFLHNYDGLNFLEKFLGIFPGVPIAYSDPYIGWFIDYQTQAVWGGVGLHPFNFHGMWFRSVFSWGAGLIVVLFIYFLMRFFKKRSGVAFSLLIIIQGMVMGVFYLSTVSVFVILYAFSLKASFNRRL